MIYLFTYQGYDCPLDLEKTFKTRKEFLDAYEKMTKAEKKDISYIIEGKELNVEPEEIEVIKSYKLSNRTDR